MAKNIMVTAQDKQRLEDCLAVLPEFPDKLELPHIQYLDQESAARQKWCLDPFAACGRHHHALARETGEC